MYSALFRAQRVRRDAIQGRRPDKVGDLPLAIICRAVGASHLTADLHGWTRIKLL
jgi:hypothetical protein